MCRGRTPSLAREETLVFAEVTSACREPNSLRMQRRRDRLTARTLLRDHQRAISRLETDRWMSPRNARDRVTNVPCKFHPRTLFTHASNTLRRKVLRNHEGGHRVEISQESCAKRSLSRGARRTPNTHGRVWSSLKRLYCELRDYRVFITPNDLSQARAGLGSAPRGAPCAFGHERWYVRRQRRRRHGGEKILSEQRSSITQGLGVHTRVFSSNRSATCTRPLFIDLPELELRAAAG